MAAARSYATWTPAEIALAVFRPMFLLVPAVLLFVAGCRAPAGQGLILWLGTIFQAIFCVIALVSRRASRQFGPLAITVYLTALSWLWFGDAMDDWFNHLAKAVFVVIPI